MATVAMTTVAMTTVTTAIITEMAMTTTMTKQRQQQRQQQPWRDRKTTQSVPSLTQQHKTPHTTTAATGVYLVEVKQDLKRRSFVTMQHQHHDKKFDGARSGWWQSGQGRGWLGEGGGWW